MNLRTAQLVSIVFFGARQHGWEVSKPSRVHKMSFTTRRSGKSKEFDPYGEWLPVRNDECRALAAGHKAAELKDVRLNVFDFPYEEILCAADNQQNILRFFGSGHRFFESPFERFKTIFVRTIGHR